VCGAAFPQVESERCEPSYHLSFGPTQFARRLSWRASIGDGPPSPRVSWRRLERLVQGAT
jgi:hypothetical protein